MDKIKTQQWIEKKKKEYMALFMAGQEKMEVTDENRFHMSRWLLLDELSQEIEKGSFE